MPIHKINCNKNKLNSSKSIVVFSGTITNLVEICEIEFNKFTDCQVSKMLRYHIMYKRLAKNNIKPLREIALFLMIENRFS